MKLAEFLRREERSASWLAFKIGSTPSATLQYIKDGNVDMRLSTALKIEQITGGQVTCEELIPKELWKIKT